MKFYLTILLAFLAYSDSFSQIRDTQWGDSISEVKSTIQEEIVHDQLSNGEHMVAIRTEVGGVKALVAYIFIEDQLFSIRYMNIEDYSNDNMYITDYNNIKEILTTKYGQPQEDESIWLDDLYRDEPSDYGFAISLGHYVKQSEWITPKTEILHMISGNNYDIRHAIQYTSVEYKSLKENKDKQENISDF